MSCEVNQETDNTLKGGAGMVMRLSAAGFKMRPRAAAFSWCSGFPGSSLEPDKVTGDSSSTCPACSRCGPHGQVGCVMDLLLLMALNLLPLGRRRNVVQPGQQSASHSLKHPHALPFVPLPSVAGALPASVL